MDRESLRISLNVALQRTDQNQTEFELFSDKHCRVFASAYRLDDNLNFRPHSNTPVVNFKELKDILLSKDLSRDDELDWTENGLRFLDGESMSDNSVCFQAFPRSGTSMLRRQLE